MKITSSAFLLALCCFACTGNVRAGALPTTADELRNFLYDPEFSSLLSPTHANVFALRVIPVPPERDAPKIRQFELILARLKNDQENAEQGTPLLRAIVAFGTETTPLAVEGEKVGAFTFSPSLNGIRISGGFEYLLFSLLLNADGMVSFDKWLTLGKTVWDLPHLGPSACIITPFFALKALTGQWPAKMGIRESACLEVSGEMTSPPYSEIYLGRNSTLSTAGNIYLSGGFVLSDGDVSVNTKHLIIGPAALWKVKNQMTLTQLQPFSWTKNREYSQENFRVGGLVLNLAECDATIDSPLILLGRFEVMAQRLINRAHLKANHIAVKIKEHINNGDRTVLGILESTGTLSLEASLIDNQFGRIYGRNDLSVAFAQMRLGPIGTGLPQFFVPLRPGLLMTHGVLNLAGETLINSGGAIIVKDPDEGQLALLESYLLPGNKRFNLNVQTLSFQGGRAYLQGDGYITTQSFVLLNDESSSHSSCMFEVLGNLSLTSTLFHCTGATIYVSGHTDAHVRELNLESDKNRRPYMMALNHLTLNGETVTLHDNGMFYGTRGTITLSKKMAIGSRDKQKKITLSEASLPHLIDIAHLAQTQERAAVAGYEHRQGDSVFLYAPSFSPLEPEKNSVHRPRHFAPLPLLARFYRAILSSHMLPSLCGEENASPLLASGLFFKTEKMLEESIKAAYSRNDIVPLALDGYAFPLLSHEQISALAEMNNFAIPVLAFTEAQDLEGSYYKPFLIIPTQTVQYTKTAIGAVVFSNLIFKGSELRNRGAMNVTDFQIEANHVTNQRPLYEEKVLVTRKHGLGIRSSEAITQSFPQQGGIIYAQHFNAFVHDKFDNIGGQITGLSHANVTLIDGAFISEPLITSYPVTWEYGIGIFLRTSVQREKTISKSEIKGGRLSINAFGEEGNVVIVATSLKADDALTLQARKRISLLKSIQDVIKKVGRKWREGANKKIVETYQVSHSPELSSTTSIAIKTDTIINEEAILKTPCVITEGSVIGTPFQVISQINNEL